MATSLKALEAGAHYSSAPAKGTVDPGWEPGPLGTLGRDGEVR